LISSSITALIDVSFVKVTPEQVFTGSLQCARPSMRRLPREEIVASCLWTPVSGLGMYAWVAAKAKTNRRGRADGGRVCVAAAQAVQALG
jgi:hypothetical protein